MMALLRTAQKFLTYQRERFPMVILALSLLPAVVSSGAVSAEHPTIAQGALALVASIVYLLHIRIIDERRDFEHDTQHHELRPVQRGVISLRELESVDGVAVVILVGVAWIAGWAACAVVVAMLAYSFLAGREFFLGEALRRRLFLYNGINLVQMLLMQIFVYTVFAGFAFLTPLVLGHFVFTAAGTLVFEFVRKLKLPGGDGTGRDTYTAHLGFLPALVGYLALAVLTVALYARLVSMMAPLDAMLMLIIAVAVLSVVVTVMVHARSRSTRTDAILQLTFVGVYAVLNLSLYAIAHY